jgi:hypothetical protein
VVLVVGHGSSDLGGSVRKMVWMERVSVSRCGRSGHLKQQVYELDFPMFEASFLYEER